ncbi:MAG: response regulator [Gemmatimonadales bacterium]
MNQGRILLADDEPTFLNSTADLLRREGYECDTVSDGASALARVEANPYDLLITDLEMPGNSDLGLVRAIAQSRGGLPVLVITGVPSVRSAIACVELPVAAYLLKPVVFSDLLPRVETAVSRFRSWQAMQQAEQRLTEWGKDYQQVAQGAGAPGNGIDVFLSLTLRNVMGSLTDLQQLGRALSGKPVEQHPCQLLNCPRGAQLQEAVRETIRVLEETRHAFKSKALGELRHKLELMLELDGIRSQVV